MGPNPSNNCVLKAVSNATLLFLHLSDIKCIQMAVILCSWPEGSTNFNCKNGSDAKRKIPQN